MLFDGVPLPPPPEETLAELGRTSDSQQQVDLAARLVARYLAARGPRPALRAALGAMLLRRREYVEHH